MVGGVDSTVVGIISWSPASGARVGGCLQSECVSQRQGKYFVHVDCSMYGMYVVVSVNVILCGQGSCCE